MGMKVCKLVRLTKKDADGKFTKGKEGQITLRKKVVVPQESVDEFDANFESTGIVYLVDEKATEERDAIVEAEVSESRGTNVFMQGLEEQEKAAEKKAADEAAKKQSPKGTL